jgi:hypothetical protein
VKAARQHAAERRQLGAGLPVASRQTALERIDKSFNRVDELTESVSELGPITRFRSKSLDLNPNHLI